MPHKRSKNKLLFSLVFLYVAYYQKFDKIIDAS